MSLITDKETLVILRKYYRNHYLQTHGLKYRKQEIFKQDWEENMKTCLKPKSTTCTLGSAQKCLK